MRERQKDVCERVVRDRDTRKGSERESSEMRTLERFVCVCVCVRERERERCVFARERVL